MIGGKVGEADVAARVELDATGRREVSGNADEPAGAERRHCHVCQIRDRSRIEDQLGVAAIADR